MTTSARTTARITYKGKTIRTATQRRFVVVYVGYAFDGSRYDMSTPSRMEVYKRSDSIETARKVVQRQGFRNGRSFIIFDTTTGEQV